SSAASAASSLCEKITELTSSVFETFRRKPVSYRILLVLSSAAMLTAFPASSLLSRLYYSDGGQSKWIISWAAVAGWPLTALFLIPAYFANRISPTPLSLKLLAWYILLGFLSAADNLMFAWAYAYLPASTASLLAASSLVFSSLFGYFIDQPRFRKRDRDHHRRRSVVIALDARSDRYEGITDKQYTLGFVWDILGSALHGLIFALSELVFIKVLGRRSFHVVLEQQVMVSFAAFAFTTLGLVVQKGFAEMRSEAERFARGGSSYAQVLFWAAVTFQLGVLGGTGVLFLASTVFAGVLNAVRVPLTSIAAVVLFQDPMSGFKILSLVITVWGFGSYVVGHSSANKPS
ncbi:putative purine permease 5, partial [Ananas comosus]